MKLIATTNFQVKEINERFDFGTGYIVVDGFGIWDIASNGWVSMGSECPVSGIPIPTRYKRKSVALECIKDGLYEGYKIIK